MKVPVSAKPEVPRNIDLESSVECIKNPYVKEFLTPGEALDAISTIARQLEIKRRIDGNAG